LEYSGVFFERGHNSDEICLKLKKKNVHTYFIVENRVCHYRILWNVFERFKRKYGKHAGTDETKVDGVAGRLKTVEKRRRGVEVAARLPRRRRNRETKTFIKKSQSYAVWRRTGCVLPWRRGSVVSRSRRRASIWKTKSTACPGKCLRPPWTATARPSPRPRVSRRAPLARSWPARRNTWPAPRRLRDTRCSTRPSRRNGCACRSRATAPGRSRRRTPRRPSASRSARKSLS